MDSALYFLNRGGLDAGAAAAGKIDGPAGFFMATVKDDDILEDASLHVPAEGLDAFSQALRTGPPNAYYPQ